MNFGVHWLKEAERLNKYLDFARELKRIVEHESDGNTNSSLYS